MKTEVKQTVVCGSDWFQTKYQTLLGFPSTTTQLGSKLLNYICKDIKEIQNWYTFLKKKKNTTITQAFVYKNEWTVIIKNTDYYAGAF